MTKMRLIYEGGQKVGPDPVGCYVYLWRHDDIDRYVGKGVSGRWADHATPDRNDRNQRKYHYFCEHGHEMTCHILAEGLGRWEVAPRELDEIRSRGFLADGSGTLLNDPKARRVTAPRMRNEGERRHQTTQHYLDFKAVSLPETATLEYLSDRNPWNMNTGGHPFYALILEKRPTTIGGALDLSVAAGWKKKQAYDHLRWLYTWGDYIAIDGKPWTKGA
jgi:hypothetical protein